MIAGASGSLDYDCRDLGASRNDGVKRVVLIDYKLKTKLQLVQIYIAGGRT